MLITRETDYALRMLRVLLDGEKHSAAEMAETELIPMQFAYQILRKLSAGELVQVSRGAAGGCRCPEQKKTPQAFSLAEFAFSEEQLTCGWCGVQ